MPKASKIHRLFERQAEDLDRLDDATLRRMLEIYERAGAELDRALAEMSQEATPFTFAQYQATLAQIQAGVEQMRRKLDQELRDGTQAAGAKGVEDILKTLELAEQDFVGVSKGIEVRSLARLGQVDSLLLHRHSLDRYTRETVEALQRELLIGLARKQTPFELRKRLLGMPGRNDYESVWLKNRSRVQLIVRMETARAADEVHRGTMEEAAAVLDGPDESDPLLARADEFRDKRNHPLSPALHGRLRRLDEDWRVPRAEVEAWQAATKYRGPPSSIAWDLVGAVYVGRTYPAHFGDRGRQTPWRRRWGDSGQLGQPEPTAPTPRAVRRAPQAPPVRDRFRDGLGRPPTASEVQQAEPVLKDMAILKASDQASSAAGLGRALASGDGQVVGRELGAPWFKGQPKEVRADVYRALARQGAPGRDLRRSLAAELAEAGRLARQGPIEFRAHRRVGGVLREIDIVGKDEIVECKRTRDLKSARKVLGRDSTASDVDLMGTVGGDRRRTLAIYVDEGQPDGIPDAVVRNAAQLERRQPGTRIDLVFPAGIRMRYDGGSATFVEVS